MLQPLLQLSLLSLAVIIFIYHKSIRVQIELILGPDPDHGPHLVMPGVDATYAGQDWA